MKILKYNELDISGVKKQYDKVIEFISQDNFYSAEVKKLSGTPYYRAKLDYTNRLLFKIISFNNQKYALMLEIIYNHDYEKSRFLNGAQIDESKIEPIENSYFEHHSADPILYLNPEKPHFHILDKIISFDAIQDEIFNINPPIVIIGSAGSGKTMLTLEKMKRCVGKVLYITNSPYLVQSARHLYFSNLYSNDDQEIDFLSYREFLEALQVPAGKEIDFFSFSRWLSRFHKIRHTQDPNRLYEEFKGVITGNELDKPYLSKQAYLNLGIKQSIYPSDERSQIYELFERYLAFLKEANLYDINLVSFDYLTRYPQKYDYVVIDEVQDFTAVQLMLVLKSLKCPQQFILCGDSNQIVHPNFFSWAKIKSLFFKTLSDRHTEMIRILNKNYRNASSITVIANKILKIKNARFGSIDKESHYLVESQSTLAGEIYSVLETEAVRQEINTKTYKSTHYAVIVLRDDQKEQARQYFQTPLVFSIYEAKGLEYDNVILYNFVSSEQKMFRDIALDLTSNDLEADFSYARVKDKSDRSLEIYKFFINALYVGITRAVKNVYFIEKIAHHALLNLLDLKPMDSFVAIEAQVSSIEEWQKEARKLEMQGKQDQADAIRGSILKTQKVPWEVTTLEYLKELREKALNTQIVNKNARLSLFEYALHYHQPELIHLLAAVKFGPALKPKKDYDLLERKYFMSYSSSNTAQVMRQVSLYGVDFRTVFNQTPLMVASSLGNHVLINQLMENGANPYLTDNFGQNAFQIALKKALLDKRFAREKMGQCYQLLSPEYLSLQVGGKLIKIDAKLMEFFLFNACIALAHQKNTVHQRVIAFTVDSFLGPLSHFPEIAMPQRRKNRSYISSILAKNEIHRQDVYNRLLFCRVKRGYYILNPDLMIKINEEWVNIYHLLQLELVKKLEEA